MILQNLNDIYFNLSIIDTTVLFARFAIIPLSTLLILYVSLLIISRFKFFKPTDIMDNFYLNFQFSRLYAVNFTALLLNGFWFYLIWNSNINDFNWSLFFFEITNLYLQLTPFIISNIILIYIYSRSNKLISKIL